MLNALTKPIKKPSVLLPIVFAIVLLSPFTVMAEPIGTSCELARTQMEYTRSVLLPLKQQQQQIQQHVRTIYQELFACQTGTALSPEQQKHCTHLQEEGAKKFQAMINVITLTHQSSQQLARQTRQAQITCPANAENAFSKTTSLSPLQEIARNN